MSVVSIFLLINAVISLIISLRYSIRRRRTQSTDSVKSQHSDWFTSTHLYSFFQRLFLIKNIDCLMRFFRGLRYIKYLKTGSWHITAWLNLDRWDGVFFTRLGDPILLINLNRIWSLPFQSGMSIIDDPKASRSSYANTKIQIVANLNFALPTPTSGKWGRTAVEPIHMFL